MPFANSGCIQHKSSMFPLGVKEINGDELMHLKKKFNKKLKSMLGDRMRGIPINKDNKEKGFIINKRRNEMLLDDDEAHTHDFDPYKDDKDNELPPVEHMDKKTQLNTMHTLVHIYMSQLEMNGIMTLSRIEREIRIEI